MPGVDVLCPECHDIGNLYYLLNHYTEPMGNPFLSCDDSPERLVFFVRGDLGEKGREIEETCITALICLTHMVPAFVDALGETGSRARDGAEHYRKECRLMHRLAFSRPSSFLDELYGDGPDSLSNCAKALQEKASSGDARFYFRAPNDEGKIHMRRFAPYPAAKRFLQAGSIFSRCREFVETMDCDENEDLYFRQDSLSGLYIEEILK